MSQVFDPTFTPADIVQDTMEELIEGSLDALRTNWEGASEPASPRASQPWSDLSESKLKIMNQGSTTEWLDIYDFTAQALVISPDQIGTTEISSAARKGTIVTGENIDPNTCTLQAKFKTVSTFSTPCEFFPLFTNPAASGVGVIETAATWETLLSSKIFVPDDAGVLHMFFRQLNCNMRFVVGAEISTETGPVSGPGWQQSVFEDLSLSSGWYDIEVQGYSSIAFPGPNYGGISGVAAKWEV